MTIIEQKKTLRREMFAKRNGLEPADKQVYDQWVCDALTQLIKERQCKTVHAYIPMGSEIDIRPLLRHLLQSGMRVVCPKTLPKHQLENRVLVSLDELETGIMGTQHPLAADIVDGAFDLIIVPGLAIDPDRYRLGYGGGYYDTFLANQRAAHKVGIYYPFQQVERVPRELHDVQLDAVLIRS